MASGAKVSLIMNTNKESEVREFLIGRTVRDLTFFSGRYDRRRPAGTLVTVSRSDCGLDGRFVRLRDAHQPGITVTVPRWTVEPA